MVGSLSRLSRESTREANDNRVLNEFERSGPEAGFDGDTFLDFLEMASTFESREFDIGVLSGLLNGRGPDTEPYLSERVLICFGFFLLKRFTGVFPSSGISLSMPVSISGLNLFLVTLSMNWSLQILGPAQYRPGHLFSSKHLRGGREFE